MRLVRLAALVCASLVAVSPAGAGTVRLYSWSDYIGPKAIPAFEAATGDDVLYDVFDSNDLAETKLLTGHSGYDLVTPNLSPHFARQLASGVWAPLDKSKLPNLANINPDILRKIAEIDPDNVHGVPWMWGTTGLVVDVDRVKAIFPDAPVDSWSLVFDPANAAKLDGCGIAMLDDAEQVLGSVLIWQGKPVSTNAPEDLAGAAEVIRSVAPHVRRFSSSGYIAGLADGDYCVAVGFSGDAQVARLRAAEAGKPRNLRYFIPKEGAMVYTDMLAIPSDAPNPAGALAFMNTLMDPEIAAAAAESTGFATANAAALERVPSELREDPNLYPPADVVARLSLDVVRTSKQARVWTNAWETAKGVR